MKRSSTGLLNDLGQLAADALIYGLAVADAARWCR
jgi:hypothetical protein